MPEPNVAYEAGPDPLAEATVSHPVYGQVSTSGPQDHLWGAIMDGGEEEGFAQPVEGEPQPVPQQQVVNEPEPEPVVEEEAVPEIDPAEYKRLLAEQERIQQALPILEYINSDPRLAQKVYGVVERHLGGGRETAEPEEPQPPQAPEKPPAYNEMDAYSDPTSDSWKYRVAQERHEKELHRFELQQIKRENQALKQSIEQSQQQQMASQQRNQMIGQVMENFGADLGEANEFVGFITNPNVSPDTLWQLFKLTKGQTVAPTAQNAQATKSAPAKNVGQKRRATPQIPLPAAAYNSNGTPAKSPDDMLFDNILREHQTHDPFTS